MRIRTIRYGAVFALATLPPLPLIAATAPAPTEEFYLTECLNTGAELSICSCIAQAFAVTTDVRADVVSAIMQDYVLMGESDPPFDEVKRDLAMVKLNASDTEIRKAIMVANSGAQCLE